MERNHDDALLTHDPLDPHAILGSPDDLEPRSPMTVYEAVGGATVE